MSVSGSNVLQLDTQDAQTFVPGVSSQTIAAGKYLTGAQTIAGDDNLVQGNIAAGNSIFGVSGSFTDADTVSAGQTAASSSEILSGYSAWVDGEEVKGGMEIATLAEISSYFYIQ